MGSRHSKFEMSLKYPVGVELVVGCRNLEFRVVVLVGNLSLNITSIHGI